jgi:hypothetical protein
MNYVVRKMPILILMQQPEEASEVLVYSTPAQARKVISVSHTRMQLRAWNSKPLACTNKRKEMRIYLACNWRQDKPF